MDDSIVSRDVRVCDNAPCHSYTNTTVSKHHHKMTIERLYVFTEHNSSSRSNAACLCGEGRMERQDRCVIRIVDYMVFEKCLKSGIVFRVGEARYQVHTQF